MTTLYEENVEEIALGWLCDLGWKIAYGADIAPDTLGAERKDYNEVILKQRLRNALEKLNPNLSEEALEDAFHKLCQPQGSTLEMCNQSFHQMVTDGVTVEYQTDDGEIRGTQVRVTDL